jgi:CRP-like cAMP-binding protein
VALKYAKRFSSRNLLLAALPAAARGTLLARGERIELPHGAVLCESGATISHAFFPLESIVTLVAAATGSAELEAGLVGNEGMLGITLMLGVPVAPVRWLVQGTGQAWRIDAASFLSELAISPALSRVLDRYLYVVLVQLAQTAACKRFHLVEARLARWLLMTRDRAGANNFHVTHEDLAYIMGVRRAGITRAASSLQQRQLIHYVRGDLRILDGKALEAASCGCYATDKNVYNKIMG